MDVFSWTVHGRTHLTNNPVNWIDPWGLSASEKRGNRLTGEQILDAVQTVLDIVGTAPVAGKIADFVNGVISLARGNYVDAALSVVSVIPVVGDAIEKGGKAARKIAGAVKRADTAVDTVKTSKRMNYIHGERNIIPNGRWRIKRSDGSQAEIHSGHGHFDKKTGKRKYPHTHKLKKRSPEDPKALTEPLYKDKDAHKTTDEEIKLWEKVYGNN